MGMFWQTDALKRHKKQLDEDHSPYSNRRAAKKMAKRPLLGARGLMGRSKLYATLPHKDANCTAGRTGGEVDYPKLCMQLLQNRATI